MFSKILVKLIDQAIVPGVLLISTKIVAMLLVSKTNGIPFGIDRGGFNFINFRHFIHVNSISTLIMVLVLALGLAYILIKSYVFHDTHITPKMTANLFSLKMEGLIQSTFDLYTQGSIWLAFLFFITISNGLMAFSGLLYYWVFYFSLMLTVVMTLFFIFDVESELKE